ncbi:MAG TPA: UDP-N-acetylmuramoyl-L-alanyl-D-glutamate--2,6-diaminopimelate ligase, partial [Gammaproteobacteria bacterium]
MARRTLGDLLGSGAGNHARLAITDLALDSRQVRPGAAFVAVAGGREHGLAYAREALERGAAVVLYEPSNVFVDPPEPSIAVPNLKARLGEIARAFYVAAVKPTIVGVTGTNGKTTVAYLLAQALSQPQRPCGYVGTLGFGVPPKLNAHGLTTPDCLTLHRELAELGAPRIAMEVSSHALAQQRIAGLEFHTAVFTNLTRDHLDEHGDFASYGNAKRKLFKVPGLQCAVLNADDAFAATIAADLAPGCKVVRTSLRDSAVELSGRLKRSDLGGVELDIGGKFGTTRLSSSLIGAFNAENLLTALGALVAQGMQLPAACSALAAAKPAPGRMEVLGGPPGKPWVVIDYAHTPDALQRVLTTLEAAATGELTCVFGCGGDRDRGKRALMGGVAADLADRIVLTDDNPRSEDPAAIVRDIRAGMDEHPRVNVIHDRRAALKTAIERARPGDVVLVAGKGHESEQ